MGGSFEGLFVKNLENVQGDERRRAALECAGDAGRRDEVHIVTSIPP